MVLLDTCALIDLISPSITLSAHSIEIMEKGAVILSISFAEIACKIEIGKLELDIQPDLLLQNIQETSHFHIQDITAPMWLDAIALPWDEQGKKHKDPADRLILSYAAKNDFALATTDRLMRQRYTKCIW